MPKPLDSHEAMNVYTMSFTVLALKLVYIFSNSYHFNTTLHDFLLGETRHIVPP